MKKEPPLYLSTGCTPLDLALSGSIAGGLKAGHYYFFVGDSTSGKTFLALTMFAEAAINSKFKDYALVFDNPEDGALMDIERYFGKSVAKRLEHIQSETIEDFYYNADDRFEAGPTIYVLDSMDALSSEAEQKKVKKQKTDTRAGTQTAGSMGDGKAKKNSALLRQLLVKIKRNNGILVIINQTRDNLGFGFETKTRSGGRALKFYATCELWTSVKQTLMKEVRGKKRQVGMISQVDVKKNRQDGRKHQILVPLLHSYGIDNIGACIDWLVSEGHWKATKGNIVAEEFDFKGPREKLIKQITVEQEEQELKMLCQVVWHEIDQLLQTKRPKRYE